MSEINLQAMVPADKDGDHQSQPPTPMQEINTALKECKFGIFQIRLLFTALIGILATVCVTNSSAYLLPNAECDLNMNLEQKGILNAMPYMGCLLSSMVAGFLTDTFGRKIFLLSGFGGIFIFTLVSGSSQTFGVLIFGRFFEGLFFAVAFSPLVTLTSEFCYNEIRDRVLLAQSSFIALAQIVIALISWSILIRDWNMTLFDGAIVLHTWNFYLYITSLLSLTAGFLYSLLPESPRFLLSQKKYHEAKEILIKVYVENTRKPASTFPCPDLWKNLASEQKIEQEEKMKTGFQTQLVRGLYNVKPMFQKKYCLYLFMISAMVLLCMLKYNVLRLWYPQLSTILEHSNMGASNITQDLCNLLDDYTAGLNLQANITTQVCVKRISGTETYINSIILGTVCLCPYLVSGALVNRVGKKALLIFGGITSFGATLGLRFATTKGLVVSLFSIDTALTQTMMSLLQASVVEYFPTTMRTLALAFMMTFGRIGTLIGNISFPILLKMGCIIPFYSLAGVVVVIAVMSIFLPKKKMT